MAKKKKVQAKEAGECPVTDAPCEKNCAKDECQATVSNDVVQSSSEKSDYASHPKFDKFKSSQGAE